MCARATGKLRILNFLSLFFNNLLGVCSFGTHLLTLVSFDHLDNELARGLIDSTVVSEYRNSQGNTVQDIQISYRLIDNIDAILNKTKRKGRKKVISFGPQY